MKITDYREIPLDEIDIGTAQARTRDVEKNVDDLARSINKLGLLEPIVVAPTDEGTYEVITGQRRFLAAKKLNWRTIRAGILDHLPEGNLAKAISLTENMVRQDMSSKDYIDACTELFKRYGSIKAVCEELGLPRQRVSEYVKFEQLVPALKEMVESGELKMDAALRANKAATGPDGEIDKTKAEAFAKEMKSLSTTQQRRLADVAVNNPDAPPEQVIEEGRRQPKIKRMTVEFAENLDSALNQFAEEEGSSAADAAVTLISSGLTEKGYLEEDSD